ncbi:MAG: cbb3-type cytochrome c oxidase subunit I [Magnetococcales bacterium]|nr:cbb3-type cytochrome c oxidase subunit I [Magnetococcales bacterium]
MSENAFFLPVPAGTARRLAVGWLYLALYSLIGAGLVVILILIARTPWLHTLLPWTGSFKTALVIHVDLSVLVWFLAFAGFLASLNLADGGGRIGLVALGVAGVGAVLITFSPFLGVDAPYMNNYVPVLENGAFFLGLLLFLTGSGVMAGYGLLAGRVSDGWSRGSGVLQFGLRSGLLILLISLGSWIWSFVATPRVHEAVLYYEAVFWGGGHLLQFTHTQLLVVVWLWLASGAGGRVDLTPRVGALILLLGALPIVYAVWLHVQFRPGEPGFQIGFADLMKYGGGVAALPVGLAVVLSLRTAPADPALRPFRVALLLSVVLFGVGGVIGFLIQGVNVTIPSHYHGSIVAVTVAYMGLTYLLLPRLGFRSVAGRLAVWQLFAYGGGSLLHVFGLAWSGMLGVQRKTAGAAQGLETISKKLAMGLTGAGGLIAVLGGILFLVICFRAIRRHRPEGQL